MLRPVFNGFILAHFQSVQLKAESKVQKWKPNSGKYFHFLTILARSNFSWEQVPDVHMMDRLSEPEVGHNLTVIIHREIFGAFPQLCYLQLSVQLF